MREAKAWQLLLLGGALVVTAPALSYAQRGSHTPPQESAVVGTVLQAIPWRKLCGQPDACRVIRVDTLLHISDHPYLTTADTIALVLPAARLRQVQLAGRKVIASRPVDRRVAPPLDTAIVWMGFYRDPRLAANERHVIAQVFVHGALPCWVHCLLKWTGDTWHVDGVWTDET